MKSNSDTRKPYSGPVRSLVLAIDVGTTFSGVSYAILEPGSVPKIHGVTRFPGQEHVAGNCKIPSILWYDSNGRMVAAGAEAETSSILSTAEDEGWIKAELFKLRLRPRTMQLNMNGMRLGRLPPGKTAVDVFGDFLAYLYLCTRNFITDTHAAGSTLWATVEHDIKFVLSHPNGWEGAQQSKLRRAAIHGGLIPNTNEGKARVFFVTEGEASLHACVLNGLAADVLSDPSKPGFLIADAGGGTWDISAYNIASQNPLLIEEIAPPDCLFAGSVFVSRRARRFLEEKLKSSKYGSAESVEHITRRFDETTKRLFRDDRALQFVSFGSPLDKDATVGIRGGQLKLTGTEVRELFEPSIEAAFDAIKAQIDASAGVIKSVWLVGGFAANHWLFSQLQERLAPFHVTINRPDSQTSKAVCDGAVGFYVDHHVSVRMSKFFYGVEYLRAFNPEDEEHVAREGTLCELPSGPRLLPDAFDCILARGLKVKESTIFSRKYSTELTSLGVLSVFEVLIWCYRGKGEIPTWIYRDKEEFSTLCVVRADLSPLKGSAEPQTGKTGKTFWKIVFSVEIHFGLTEFRARIKWIDSNGEIKYGPASIVYNERGRRMEEDEPDIFPEDDITVKSSRSDRMRSPPPLSRPHSSAAGLAPETSVVEQVPWTDMIPEVARLPDEFEESVGASHSTQEEVAANSVVEEPVESSSKAKDREPSRGRKPGKGKGKGKEKEKAPNSADSRTSSRLADTLTSVWGKDGSPSPTHDPGAAPEGNAEEHSALGEVTVEATVDAAPTSPAVKVNEVRSVKATAPSTPKPEPAPLETPTAPESLAPVNDSAQEASEPAASRPRSPSASAADVVRQINPEEMPLPASPAESPTPDIQAEKSPAQSPAPELHPEESTAAPASEFLQVEAAANTAEGGGSKKVSPQPSPALHPKSLPGSSKQSPRVSPVPPERLLPTADVIVTPGVAAQCSSSPQMVLPELIALPLSAVGSPKSAVSPKLHASPLGIFENAVLPAELAGTGFLGSSSRPVSTAVSPRFNVIDVGDVTEGGSFVPARTPRQRSQACTPKQSQQASPLIKGAAIGNTTAHSGDHTPTNREGEDLFGDTFWSHGEMEGGGDWSFIGRADLKDSKA